ncbi:hypothetical protein L6R46_32605, partial [Myxococcota bacterium]|nr:hypothetical protein [Myxococcota bacterium]
MQFPQASRAELDLLLRWWRLIQADYVDGRPLPAPPPQVAHLARALDRYRSTGSDAARQRWVRSGLADIGAALQRADTLADFAQRLFAPLMPMFGGGAAALYLCDADACTFCGGWGGQEQALRERRFPLGEGLLGQVARDAEPRV